ncbi:MAG TPA: hypothetical protein VMY38_02895 [Gemmatimonadaceae bacterium]|nr:hypothetical protein [Gemmatimonadaceae bacterium]
MGGRKVVEEAPLELRLRDFKRSFWQAAGTLAFLIGLNVVFTPQVPWVLLAAIIFSIGLIRQAAGLWADGVSLRELVARGPLSPDSRSLSRESPRALPERSNRSSREAGRLRALAGSEVSVNAGPTERAMARAREHHDGIVQTMRQLSTVDRELIPDVRPTIDALLEQVLVLGDALRRLEENAGMTSMDEVGARIEAMEIEQIRTAEWERKRDLLERQRVSIKELQQRQADLRARFERSTLLLENLRLDVLKLRSSGVQSASEDVVGATQQARALSSDIRRALEAADEVKSIR